MRRLVFILLLLLHFSAWAGDTLMLQSPLPDVSMGSRTYLHGWLFAEGDDSLRAMPGYDDSHWQTVTSTLDSQVHGADYYHFSSIGWFRLHFRADTALLDSPLLLALTHWGASEVFLDGVLLCSNGLINGPEHSIYVNPAHRPLAFTLQNTGPHVLAVRYAYYAADYNRKTYNSSMRGIYAQFQPVSHFINREHNRILAVTVLFILLTGVFGALGLCHLLLFLYNRSIRSNLYFSIFCAGLSAVFLMLWLDNAISTPGIYMSRHFIMPVIVSVLCFGLSGLVNDLFSSKRLRFRIVIALCILAPMLFWWANTALAIAALSLFVLAEATVVILRAMIRRVKGSFIIGAGMLVFLLTVGFVVTYILITRRDLVITEGSAGQALFSVFSALAIICPPVSMSVFLAWNFAQINKELKKNLRQVQELSDKTLAQELEKNRIIAGRKEELEREVAVRTAEVVNKNEQLELRHNELIAEKHKSDELLLNILPEEVAEELKRSGHADARLFNDVSVIFTDFVGFTNAGERMTPQELVDELHICFRTFDEIISRHHIEKIKTIGDAYLAVSGLPVPNEQHAYNVTKAALEILTFMKQRRQQLGDKTFEIRIGINSGSVVAGIVGIKKFAYDIWGDTVNTAARMEQNSEPGRINISENTWQLIKDRFRCTYRGMIDAKNKGQLKMYFVEEQE